MLDKNRWIKIMGEGTTQGNFFLFNTYFTSVYPTAMWLQCNRPITGAEGSYKASDG